MPDDHGTGGGAGWMSLREALWVLRNHGKGNFGTQGWMVAHLSDGTQLTADSANLVRCRKDGKVIRKYPWVTKAHTYPEDIEPPNI